MKESEIFPERIPGGLCLSGISEWNTLEKIKGEIPVRFSGGVPEEFSEFKIRKRILRGFWVQF